MHTLRLPSISPSMALVFIAQQIDAELITLGRVDMVDGTQDFA